MIFYDTGSGISWHLRCVAITSSALQVATKRRIKFISIDILFPFRGQGLVLK